MSLGLPTPVLATLHRALADDEERCGILVGVADGDGAVVRRAVSLPNVAADRRRRFAIAPADLAAAIAAARGEGLALVGLWHSHPAAPAEPSAADAEGGWRGARTLLVGRGDAGVETRCFTLGADGWREDEIREVR